jgi:aryl-alcohol dehydrogenase-like predicted oxidoreductase
VLWVLPISVVSTTVTPKITIARYGADTRVSIDDVRGEKRPDWMKYFQDRRPNPDWLARRDAIKEILRSEGRSLAQGALAWLWTRSPLTVPIPGFCTVAQVVENAGALAFGALRPEQVAEIERILGHER